MGNSLDTVSPTSLPCPTSQTNLQALKELGLAYPETCELKRNTMCNGVRLASNVALHCTSNRGDICSYDVIRFGDSKTSAQIIASVFWMSKGAYDNECNIQIQNEPEAKDMSGWMVEKHWVVRAKERDAQPDIKEYIRALNEYVVSYEMGCDQTSLNSKWEIVEKLKPVAEHKARALGHNLHHYCVNKFEARPQLGLVGAFINQRIPSEIPEWAYGSSQDNTSGTTAGSAPA